MNIVIPFRNTGGQAELKMTLDLLFSNYQVPFRDVIVMGDPIDAYNSRVRNIVIEERIYNKWLDCNFLIKAYITEVGKDEPFIIFNDDFFVIEPVTEFKTNFYCGLLNTRMEKTFIADKKIGKVRLSEYGLNIKACIAANGNIPNAELHLPMYVANPAIMLNAIQKANEGNYPAMRRSLYLHMTRENITEIPSDVKFGEPHMTLQRPFFSLTDDQFCYFRDELAASINRIHELEVLK